MWLIHYSLKDHLENYSEEVSNSGRQLVKVGAHMGKLLVYPVPRAGIDTLWAALSRVLHWLSSQHDHVYLTRVKDKGNLHLRAL